MAKYQVQGRVTLQVEGEIEADSYEDAADKALGLLECFTPDMPLSVIDQPDYEFGSVTLIQ